MGISVRGIPEVQKRLDAEAKRLRTCAEAGLYLVAGNIVGEAAESAPLDKGPLRASKYATHPERRSGRTIVEIGFGGPAAEYAARQHEDLSLNHDVGHAKFLELAVNRAGATFASDVAAVARAQFESGASSLPSSGINTRPGGGS